MASTYPYTSGSGPLVQVIVHLRRSFPASVTAETLKKLGIASNNESYIINILRFVNAIDEKGAKTQAATKVFSKHDDAEFQTGFADLIKVAYGDLFVLHGDDAWTLETNKLISFFRNTDQTSDVVGKRQASTFQTLAAQAGQTIPQSPRRNGTSPPKPIPRRCAPKPRIIKRTSLRPSACLSGWGWSS